MPKVIYAGDRLAAVVLEGDEIGHVTACVRYALAEMESQGLAGAWPARADVERILRDLTSPAPASEPKRPA